MAAARKPTVVPDAAGADRVYRFFPGATIVVTGSGPSLTRADCALAAEAGCVFVAVNSSYTIVPSPEVVYAADYKWWKWQAPIPDRELPPLCYSIRTPSKTFRPRVIVLQRNGRTGISTDPTALRIGGHGGYQAVNLAYLLGARRILLLGMDMEPAADGRHHCHPEHPDQSHPNYPYRIGDFASAHLALRDLGVELLNCTRRTAIPSRIVPLRRLEEVL